VGVLVLAPVEVVEVDVVFDFFGDEGPPTSSCDFLVGLDIMNANAFLVAGADILKAVFV